MRVCDIERAFGWGMGEMHVSIRELAADMV